jgi:hypothetical protein
LDLDFSVPILRGDASLAEEFVVNLQCQIMQSSASSGGGYANLHITQLLFHLVILRTYLSRPPENDIDIFELVRDGRVSRIWTVHEQALAACNGEDDTGIMAKLDQQPDPNLWKNKRGKRWWFVTAGGPPCCCHPGS